MCSKGLGEQTPFSTQGTSPLAPEGSLGTEQGHMLDPSSSGQGWAPRLTGRLLEALGGVDDDVQEPVEPRGLVICSGKSRG